MHVPEMNSIQAQPAYYRMHKTKDMFHLQAHPILIIIKKYTIVTVIAHALIIRYKRTPALISGISACAFKRGIRVSECCNQYFDSYFVSDFYNVLYVNQ